MPLAVPSPLPTWLFYDMLSEREVLKSTAITARPAAQGSPGVTRAARRAIPVPRISSIHRCRAMASFPRGNE